MRLSEFVNLKENATAGATGSGSVATVSMPIGGTTECVMVEQKRGPTSLKVCTTNATLGQYHMQVAAERLSPELQQVATNRRCNPANTAMVTSTF
jgi:hypothetical protein